jgi:predicted nucleic acid-binding Zn finger protein
MVWIVFIAEVITDYHAFLTEIISAGLAVTVRSGNPAVVTSGGRF